MRTRERRRRATSSRVALLRRASRLGILCGMGCVCMDVGCVYVCVWMSVCVHVLTLLVGCSWVGQVASESVCSCVGVGIRGGEKD
jgi:type IV secretory pathway TrbF-like protein